jgi:hypothetical protein
MLWSIEPLGYPSVSTACDILGLIRLPHNNHRGLLRLGFDPSDLPFVAVCYHTPDKLLVAEGSDYHEAIKEYLKDEMGVQVLTISEALQQV